MNKLRILLVAVMGMCGSLILAQELPRSTLVFRATEATASDHAGKSLNVTIRDIQLDANDDQLQQIQIPAFALVTVVSGRVEAITATGAVMRQVNDFWTLNAGSALKIRVLGESAILRVLFLSR